MTRDEVGAFVLAHHDRACRPACPDREECARRWSQHLPRGGVFAAAEILRSAPRAVHAARLALHDSLCMSGCEGARRDDHARRTTGSIVSALRTVVA